MLLRCRVKVFKFLKPFGISIKLHRWQSPLLLLYALETGYDPVNLDVQTNGLHTVITIQ